MQDRRPEITLHSTKLIYLYKYDAKDTNKASFFWINSV
jgi:hypothetical protein